MNYLLKQIGILLVVGLAISGNCIGQSSSIITGGIKMLTGHVKSSEKAVKEATDIVIATFIKLGFPGSDSDGADFYEQAQIQVFSALKGTLSGNVQVSYSVQAMPGKDQESAPASGVQYLMFMQKLGPTEYEIKKLMPATEANVSAIKALIAGASAH